MGAEACIPAVAGGYAGAGRYVANSAGVVHVAKREAEAEADADAFYGVYGYSGYQYATTYGAYGAYGAYGYPYAYGAYSAYAHPYSYAPYAAYTTAAVAGGYAGAGRYVANSAGVVHVAKREAEAEP